MDWPRYRQLYAELAAWSSLAGRQDAAEAAAATPEMAWQQCLELCRLAAEISPELTADQLRQLEIDRRRYSLRLQTFERRRTRPLD